MGILQKGCNIWNLYRQASPFVDLFTWAAANDHSKPIPIPMIGGISELMMQDVIDCRPKCLKSLNQLSDITTGHIIYHRNLQYKIDSECSLLLRLQSDSKRDNMNIYIIETIFFNKK